jgi:hypothetical protein
MESLAFADGAFHNEIKSPHDIYTPSVSANHNRPGLIVLWKPEWRDK